MIRAKVLFGFLSKNVSFEKLSRFGKSSNVAFTLKNKVNPYLNSSNMTDFYKPPNVQEMKILDRNAFKKTLNLPCLIVENKKLNVIRPLVKKYIVKIKQKRSIQEVNDAEQKIFINPELISSWNDFEENIKNKLEECNITEDNFTKASVELDYDNWNASALLKAVLPKDIPILRSYSLIGHIIHLNIKEELLDYKYVIADILLDKVQNAKTVICKKNIIDNVYRNFEIELLRGEPNFIATVTENQCKFELDFSKVYWNPRLSTEHMRIVKDINQGDVLFDVFAGIGPYAIPAAKKKCFVFANDLNPESIKWLKHNITLNKKAKEYITHFNKDGKDFILDDVRENILKFWKDDFFCSKIHVVMNLPATAPKFMKYFKALITKNDLVNLDVEKIKKCLPIINCYFFTHGEVCWKTSFEQTSEMILNGIEHSLHFVRKVSDSGSMVRITFRLPFEYLVGEMNSSETDEPLPKRICTN